MKNNDGCGCLASLTAIVLLLSGLWLIAAVLTWIVCSIFSIPCNAILVTKVWGVILLLKAIF